MEEAEDLERVRVALLGAAGRDTLALRLAEEAFALLATLADVAPVRPGRSGAAGPSGDPVVEAGLQALAWVAEERGLGGQAELHGLAWASDLDAVWERFVEGAVRGWAAGVGGTVTSARERASWLPIRWEPRGAVSMGHLAPDVVVRVGRHVVIFDAKYKAHLAGLDAEGWRAFSEEERAAHRADVHQALAYAAPFEAEAVTTVLAYPLRAGTWARLAEAPDRHGGRGRRRRAEGAAGARRVAVRVGGGGRRGAGVRGVAGPGGAMRPTTAARRQVGGRRPSRREGWWRGEAWWRGEGDDGRAVVPGRQAPATAPPPQSRRVRWSLG